MATSLTPFRERASTQKGSRPRIVLSLLEANQAELIRIGLRRLGWVVLMARSPSEVGQLLATAPGSTAILGTEQDDESNWLTCAKVKLADSASTVLLIGPDTPRNHRLANFVGATALLSDPVEVADWVPPYRTESRK